MAGVGVAGSIIAVNRLTQQNKPNKPTLSEKCGFNKELETLFSEIKKLYSDFKEKYQSLKEKISQEKVSKPINDPDFLKINGGSCFKDYWDFSHSSLTPFIVIILKSQDRQLKELSKLADDLSNKIDNFEKQKNQVNS